MTAENTLDSAPLSKPLATWNYALLIAAGFVMVTAWNLTLQTVENPDEPRYAAPARLMIEGASWAVPEYNTNTRLQKPILYYWMIAYFGKLGQSVGLEMSVAMRWASLLAGMFGVLGIFAIGKRLYNLRTGLLAAGILTTAKMYHELSRYLIVDVTLTAFLVWSWYFAIVALDHLREKRSATKALLGFYLCLGGACLTKGPVLVVLFVALPLVVYMAWSRRLKDLLRSGFWWGIPLALLPSALWIYELWQLGYQKQVEEYLMFSNAGRAVGAKDHQRPEPFLFYLSSLGDYFAPWFVALPAVIAWSVSFLRKKNAPPEGLTISDSSRILICATALPFVLLGLSLSKRALWILPLYPFFALWVALAWDRAFASRDGTPAPGWKKIAWVLSALIAIAGVVAFATRSKWGATAPETMWTCVCAACSAFGMFAVGLNAAGGRRVIASLQTICVAALLMISYEAVFRPIHERRENRIAFFAQVKKTLGERPIVLVGDSSNEAVWYLHRPKEYIENVLVHELDTHFFNTPGKVLLIRKRDFDRFPKLQEVLVIEESYPRGTKDTWLLTHADPAKKPDPSLFIVPEKHRHRPERKAADDEGE